MTSKRIIKLPGDLTPRGLTIAQAAALAGLSEGRFSAARTKGEYPKATLPGGRIDRMLLEQAMDRLSGITHQVENDDDPLSAWKRKRDARRA